MTKKKEPIIYDANGWVKADQFKPDTYDLVLVENANGRRQAGWWTGSQWDFGSKRISAPFVAWRRQKWEQFI